VKKLDGLSSIVFGLGVSPIPILLIVLREQKELKILEGRLVNHDIIYEVAGKVIEILNSRLNTVIIFSIIGLSLFAILSVLNFYFPLSQSITNIISLYFLGPIIFAILRLLIFYKRDSKYLSALNALEKSKNIKSFFEKLKLEKDKISALEKIVNLAKDSKGRERDNFLKMIIYEL